VVLDRYAARLMLRETTRGLIIAAAYTRMGETKWCKNHEPLENEHLNF
jgi:hypothetical protein